MDGTERIVLHNTSLVWPNALTLDFQTQTLFWADANQKKVEASEADGTNRRLITTTEISHPFSIAVLNTTLYLTDWTSDSLKVISNFEGAAVTTMNFCGRPFGIRVVDQSVQPFG